MKFALLFSILFVICIEGKVSPFIPKENTKQDIDIAKVQYLKVKSQQRAVVEKQSSDLEEVLDLDLENTTEKNHDDDTSDTIPIVVGCVLAAMIVVVMLSYFVLRARANKK